MHPQTYLTLMEARSEKWSRAYCPRRRYSMMTTNIVESLNKCMMKARRLPITSAHEFLRHMFQKWFSDKHTAVARLKTIMTSVAVAHVNLAHAVVTSGTLIKCHVFMQLLLAGIMV